MHWQPFPCTHFLTADSFYCCADSLAALQQATLDSTAGLLSGLQALTVNNTNSQLTALSASTVAATSDLLAAVQALTVNTTNAALSTLQGAAIANVTQTVSLLCNFFAANRKYAHFEPDGRIERVLENSYFLYRAPFAW